MSKPEDVASEVLESHGEQMQTNFGRQLLEDKLSEEGLDTKHWLPTLKKTLGVTNVLALNHLSHADYLKLEPHVKYPWEKHALKKILKIPDSNLTLKKVQEERSDLRKKEQEQAKLTLKELKEMFSTGIKQDDEEVKKKLETLRLAMSIPKECWPPSGKALNQVIENLHNVLRLSECSLLARENLDDREVLKLASGGRALEGIYKTKNLEDLMKKRDQLINVPENFILFGPEQGPVFQTKEFSSYISEATFTQVMDNLGFSSSCKAKIGYMGFSLETSNLYSKMSEFEHKMKSHAEKAYICTITYNYIPLASCFFQKQQIKLSSAALHELKEIEELLSHTTKQDTLQMMKARFGNFFNRFGSHVDTGPFHFGGVFWWKASSEGFKSENLEEMKRITTQALNVYVGASYCGFGVSIGGSVGVSSSHSAASFQGNSTEVLQKNIQLSVTKTGGPVEVDSLPQWKTGLLASNKTWCVIDRCFNLVPMWDILLNNHKNDFKNVFEVSRGLMEAYKVITKQEVNILFGEELASAVNEAQSFLQDIASWEVNDAEEQLKKLIFFKQKLIEKTKNDSTWINVCLSNKAFSDFLSKVVETYEKVPANESIYIKTQMRCLVDSSVYSTENSKRYSSIMRWIYHSDKEQEEMRIANFDQLIQVLYQEKRNLEEANSSFKMCAETVQEAQVKSTSNISLSLYSLLKALRATKQTDIELLIVTFAVTLGYSLETSYFRYHLGCPEIDFMLNEMQEAHKEYISLKDQCLSQAHAFILLKGLTIAPERKEVTAEQRTEHLCFMMDHMKETLSNEVFKVVQRFLETNDLKSLEKELHALILGNVHSAGRVTYKENLVRELSDISLAVNQVNTSTSVNEDTYSSGSDRHLPIPTQELSDLMKQLGLENHYPKKMTREQVHVISQFTQEVTGSHPSKESELPHYYLQKLMIMDYRARDLICKSKDVTDPCYVAVSNEMCLPDKSKSIIETLFGVHNKSPEIAITKRTLVHPMNMQMAIYHCADDFMRQWISTKLSICQFALPFLVPNPSTGEIEFPLWSFRQVKKNWQQNKMCEVAPGKTKYSDKFISKVPTPIVSFFRLGKSAFSKSQLMNSLLSEHNHNIFFHRHCRGSSNDSFLMSGVAEIFWYCPSGKDSDRFEQFTAFTNLHGDAEEYIKQATFLQSMSSVNVIFLSSSDRNAMSSHIVKVLTCSPKPLILLCTDLENTTPIKCENVVKMSIKNRNESELIDDLIAVINDLLKSPAHTYTLDDCATFARHSGFLIDEDNKDCKEGHSLAKTLMCLISDTKVADMKEALLPLQGSLWHRWCEKDKELTRLKEKGNRSIEQHRSEIEFEKNAIRQSQVERAYPLNDLMKSLITILQWQPEQTKLYFLHWLKVSFDDLSSDQLPDLHQQYHILWSKIRSEEGQKGDLNLVAQKHLDVISNEISESMFGLEHILREVGQIYEALDALKESNTSLITLPKIAADLMINGFPIELMDGDASYVPLKWVEAVFDELIKKQGDKRVFVLSVLGIQSTGKSTLLNTMFGLQFAVSAGRCTRGAFMQLVKIDENFKQDLGFDFILVVDTEGLRSVELANKSTLNHDNELATFVIGLGNMTLINIYGENPSEIQDILQIAVQAFLRMKQVKLSPSCLFVHQNVGDLAARDKNMAGRRRLQQKLDEMAHTAGQHELCDVTCFSDVIRFDANSHIHYFSHLWEGNPPMAPLNPNYSQDVNELRNQILMMAKNDCESQTRMLNMSQLKTRIRDLWTALLNENFVFSFKNTLEISVYNNMEMKFSSWTWKLRSHMLNLQSKYNNRIKNGDMSHIEKKHLEEQVQEQYDDIMKDLEVYFTEDRDCEILIQWKSSVEKQLQILKQTLTEEIERKSEELIKYKKSQSKLYENKSEYEDHLIKKSKDLALKLKNEALDEMKLRDSFDQVWIQWVTEVSDSAPKTEDPKILVDVENAILSHFKQEHNISTKIRDVSKLKKFIPKDSEHIKMRTKFCVPQSLNENDKICIKKVKDSLANFVREYVEHKRLQKMAYNVNYIHEILNEISKVADSASTGSSFKLTSAYKIDLSLYLCHIAANKFICMHKEFQKSNNPVIHLESKREDFFNCFKIFCQGATSITAFAEVLCNKLKEATQMGTYEKAALKIADQMRSDYPAFNGNRTKLEKHILKSLAENEDFEEYRKYIHFPKEYFETYIKTCVDEYCLDAKHQRLTKILNMTLDNFRSRIVIAIGEATQVVKDKNGNASMWLDELCRTLMDDLNISRSELKVIEHQEIADLEFLIEVMTNKWESTVQSLQKDSGDISLDTFHVKPHEILTKQLCGCWEQCPFCNAICTNTISGHDGEHSVHFHRPQVLTGIQWYQTDHLVTDICSSLVASNCLFVLSESNQIPYKNYRQAGPPYSNWSITPDTSSQSYWKWFVCHFRDVLAKDYCGKFEGKGAIPPAWEQITKQDVISELHQT